MVEIKTYFVDSTVLNTIKSVKTPLTVQVMRYDFPKIALFSCFIIVVYVTGSECDHFFIKKWFIGIDVLYQELTPEKPERRVNESLYDSCSCRTCYSYLFETRKKLENHVLPSLGSRGDALVGALKKDF